MLEHIFRIKVNGQVIYTKKDFNKFVATQNTTLQLNDNNASSCERLNNMEVLNNARRS